MTNVVITRADIADGKIGVLTVDGLPICLTMERPWKGNEVNVSCIPFGSYQCKRINSPKYRETFEVCDVMGRTHILFHQGNTTNDSKGCILFGTSVGEINDLPAVTQSNKARYKFMKLMDGVDEFKLIIK